MRKYQSGFSMVELLVGTVISLLVTITVAGSAQFLDTQKRITVGTNGVLETLAISYREVSNDIKMAGYGVSKCQHIYYKLGSVATVDVTQPLIIKATNTNSDELVSFYGESTTGSAYSFLSNSTVGDTFSTTYAGQLNKGLAGSVSDGSLVIIKQPKDSTGVSPACGIFALDTISIASGVTSVSLGKTISGNVWGTDSSITYPINSMAFGLSSIKAVTTKIVSNTLQEVDSFRPTITNQIADNIVFFKAYYGLEDGTFVKAEGTWEASSLTVATTKQIRSIRVFLVARAPVLNKKNAAGNCDATDDDHKVISSWLGYDSDGTLNSDNDGPTFDVSTITDGQCYKYMKSDFIVPLRNKVLSDLNI